MHEASWSAPRPVRLGPSGALGTTVCAVRKKSPLHPKNLAQLLRNLVQPLLRFDVRRSPRWLCRPPTMVRYLVQSFHDRRPIVVPFKILDRKAGAQPVLVHLL